MKNLKDRIAEILPELQKKTNNEDVQKNADYLSFIISLLPIPGVQQVGQVANKIVNDAALAAQFKAIKSQIDQHSQQLGDLGLHIDKVETIAATIKTDITVFEKALEDFINTATQSLGSEFIIDTQNWSVQKVIGQIISADWVSISAINNSQNYLLNTHISSPKTHLIAHNHSVNIIDGTQFADQTGSIGMQGVAQRGNIHVEGPSVVFSSGSSLEFQSGSSLLFSAKIKQT